MTSRECNSDTRVPLTRSVSAGLRAARPLLVQICEPQLCSFDLPYLPAMWGVLKTYWERFGAHPDHVHWYEPIFRMEDPDRIVDELGDRSIDVLGLSCYTWNWRLQREIARRVRARYPESLIVAGGPHPDYRDPEFFERNPFIDAVVVKDGEIPFNRILERALEHESMDAFRASGLRLDDIPGLCLPGSGGRLTAPAEVPSDYSVSAYLSQRTYYEQFIQAHPNGVVAAWETSRGCPFKCSYCDWGSSTMSKVRRFDMERLRAEIEWFAQTGVSVIFSVDSNFGMFKTDVDLTDAIVQAKENHGSPKFFVWSNAKNVPDRTIEITRKVVQAGLDTAHTLSIQHSSLDVLAATDRQNISVEKQIRVVRKLQAEDVPISAQLILGLPGDTPDLWRRTFTDLMEWGIHDGHIVTNYHLLPNAPAAAPAYMEEWRIRTIDRYIYDGPGVRPDEPVDPLTFARGDIIVATSTFDTDDWIRMSVEAALLRALHNGGVTQYVARYLRATHGVSFHEFYADVIDVFLPRWDIDGDLLLPLESCFRRFIEDESSLAMVPLDEGGQRRMAEPYRWCLAVLVRRLDDLLDALAAHLHVRFGHGEMVRSLCAYQRAIQVRPTYDRLQGRRVPVSHDWVRYFEEPATMIPSDGVPEPRETPGGALVIDDQGWDDGTGRGTFDWPVGRTGGWARWFDQIACNRMSAVRCTHQSVRVETAEVGTGIRNEERGSSVGAPAA